MPTLAAHFDDGRDDTSPVGADARAARVGHPTGEVGTATLPRIRAVTTDRSRLARVLASVGVLGIISAAGLFDSTCTAADLAVGSNLTTQELVTANLAAATSAASGVAATASTAAPAAGSTALPAALADPFSACFSDTDETHATAARDAIQRTLDAGVDPELLVELLTRCHASGLSGAQVATEIARVERLAVRELPAELAVDRILQGLAKGVPYARIEPVAVELESRLGHAADLLDAVASPSTADASRAHDAPNVDIGGGTTAADGSRRETRTTEETRERRRQMVGDVAYALGAGVPDAGVTKSMQLALDQDLSLVSARAPILALGGMVASGLPADRSLEIVEEAWHSGFRDVALEELGSQLSRLQRDDPDGSSEVIDELLQDLRAYRAPDRVLERLEEIVGPSGAAAPGVGPNADPGQIRGPGGPPDDPGRQNPGGPRHDPPGPGPGGH